MTNPVRRHEMPFVRIELAVLGLADDALQVLLGRRTEAPHAGQWALPGGVLRIDQDPDLDAACQRVAAERLGLTLRDATQLMAVGGRSRDPRAPWALSVVYRCTILPQALRATPGKRLAALKWVNASDTDDLAQLAFDHGQLIDHAVKSLRADVADLRFRSGLLPPTFTLGELQRSAEVILGRALDKSSFRRRLEAAGCVTPVEGELRTGAFRPAQLYRLRSDQPG